MSDLISRQAAIDALNQIFDRCEEIEAHLPEGDPDRIGYKMYPDYITVWKYLHQLPSAEPEDYTELKREFIRMASYIDVLLECSDEQKETLIGFISRLAEFMPWTERD